MKTLVFYVYNGTNIKRHKPSLNIIITKAQLNEVANKNRTNQTLTPTIVKELSVHFIVLMDSNNNWLFAFFLSKYIFDDYVCFNCLLVIKHLNI